MPAKPPPSHRLRLVHGYFLSSQTCHTLRDLERALPPVASIAGMQVKDYLQQLVDEGAIRVEKIGSGNWYFCFSGDERQTRAREVARLQAEHEQLQRGAAELQQDVQTRKLDMHEDDSSAAKNERDALLAKQASLTAETAALRVSVAELAAADLPTKLDGIREFKTLAERWTENVWILESRIAEMLAGDNEALEGLKREVYGSLGEYEEGVGLRELDE